MRTILLGGLDYNAPPPDARERERHQGIQIENTFGSETQTGKRVQETTRDHGESAEVEVPDPMQDFDDVSSSAEKFVGR